ncbi:hypothetical protein [Blastococcus colisei]|uniref:hypothetical protein n=1 Tax=Blastococcus colisei TaxID=1564162 RepID=UPI001476D444|nr:hypothetical protein [Blastococcus colisei]
MDDEPSIREVLELPLLGYEGSEVRTADDGTVAVAVAVESDPNAALLDVMLLTPPGLGFDPEPLCVSQVQRHHLCCSCFRDLPAQVDAFVLGVATMRHPARCRY